MNIFLAVVEAYNPATPGTETLYFASKGFNTSPTDVPASQHFDGLLLQPSAMRRDMFSAGTTMGRSRSSVGDVVLANPNGELDYLLDYSFDGRAITVYYGAETATYPSGFGTVVKGSVEQMELGRERLTLKLRDRQYEVDVPLQTTLYAGDNALPAGLEGVATDLKGKPKPWLKGVVKNIAPPQVNSSKLIYQVSDGAVDSVPMVFDSGNPDYSARSFTSRTNPVGASPQSCVWSPEDSQFVLLCFGSGADQIATSPDGTTWTQQTLDDLTDNWWEVRYGGGLYVVVGCISNPYLYTSPDGVTWTARTSNFGHDSIRAVGYGAGNWVAVGSLGNSIISSDGTTWAASSGTVPGGFTCNAVIYAFGQWFCCDDDGDIHTSTDDGDTWTEVYAGAGTLGLKAMSFANGKIVAVGLLGTVVTSVDGVAWESSTAPALVGTVSDIGYGFGHYLAAGVDGYATSPDGINWSSFDPGYATLNAVAFGDTTYGTWVIGGQSSALYSSSGAGGDYASEADLLDDSKAPIPGQFKAYPTGGYFRLGSNPVGQITADVTEGAAAGDRTAGQVWTDALIKLGKTSVDWSAADVTALDSDNSSVVGYYSDTDEVKGSDVLDQIAGSIGAWWGVDRSGIFRIQRLEDPQDGTSAHTFVASDMVSPLTRLPARDADRGIPTYRNIVKHSKYYAVQKDGLAGGVSDVRRGDLAKEWREETSTDTTVQTAHKLAPVNVVETLLTTAANASTEAARLQTLRGVRRDRYEFTVALDATTVTLDLGSVVTIIHPRFGLAAGGKFTIISVDPDSAKRTITFGVWGSATVFARWPYVGVTETFARADTGTYMFDPEPHSVAPAGVATVTLTMGTV